MLNIFSFLSYLPLYFKFVQLSKLSPNYSDYIYDLPQEFIKQASVGFFKLGLIFFDSKLSASGMSIEILVVIVNSSILSRFC